MLRKMMIALLATAAVAMLAPDVASAQRGFGGGGGGGFRGGGFGGGGGFRGTRDRRRRWLPCSRHRWWRLSCGPDGRRLPCSRHRWWRLSCGPDGRRLSYGPDGRRLSCGPDGRRLSYGPDGRRLPCSRHRWWRLFVRSRWAAAFVQPQLAGVGSAQPPLVQALASAPQRSVDQA